MNSNLFNNIIIAVMVAYVNNKPYKKPNILSKIIPNICWSKSELKNFLILFKINNDIKKINGIDIIILKILVKNS